jgi:uncharacterized protein
VSRLLSPRVEGHVEAAPRVMPRQKRRAGIAIRLCRLLAPLVCVWFATFARAAEVIPPAPRDHFNDYAGIVAPSTATQLNNELAQFERDTSNQIVVVIYPHMQSASSIEDYTVRVFQAWGVGQKGRSNGAVLFIFSQDRKVRIVTGYGLEGALPDALCKRIIEDEITPRFRAGDFTGGVAAGTRAMMAAARGEYRGTGQTVAEQSGRSGASSGLPLQWIIAIVFFIVMLAIGRRRARGNTVYSRRGVWTTGPWWGGGGGGWSGGGGGWSGGGGGGSFSGGGGSTGGGGAGGSW